MMATEARKLADEFAGKQLDFSLNQIKESAKQGELYTIIDYSNIDIEIFENSTKTDLVLLGYKIKMADGIDGYMVNWA